MRIKGGPMISAKLSKFLLSLAVLVASLGAAQAHLQHPIGKTELDWHPDAHIARTVSMNIDFQGGDWFVAWRRQGHVEKRDGRSCLVGPYFYFDVDDKFAFDIDETVTLELLFDRSATDGFNVSYDQAVNPTFKQIRFAPEQNGRWQKVVVQLERARFANRKTDKTDFAIGALGAIQPPNKQVNAELVLCDLKISREHPGAVDPRPLGKLQLHVTNEKAEKDSVRVGLYGPDGKSPLAGQDAVLIDTFADRSRDWPVINKLKGWPSAGHFVFYVDGQYQADVRAGTYDLVVYKGPEYRIYSRRIQIAPGQTSRVDVKLARWIDMPAQGWYSADDHIHIARPDASRNPSILAFTRAEDIHLANLLQMSNVRTNDYFRQYAFGPAGQYSEGDHSLASGQESPRSSHRGHTIGLNATQYVWDGRDYFVYDKIARRIHEVGGLWGYAHVAIDAFNVKFGLGLDVALGVVDFVEMLQMNTLNTDYLYDFLNLGYKVLPAAGSDFPFIQIAGSERIYAHVEGQFTPKAWFDAWRHGRSFVSNGPIIDFTVNGDARSTEFEAKRGETFRIAAGCAVNPDIDVLDRLELVVEGKVVKSVAAAAAGAERLELTYDLPAVESQWAAIRAYGKATSLAHTSPIYLYVDGNRRFWDRKLAPAIAEKYIQILRTFKGSRPDLNEEWEWFDTEHELLPKWDANKRKLDQSIDSAIATYERLAREAKSSVGS